MTELLKIEKSADELRTPKLVLKERLRECAISSEWSNSSGLPSHVQPGAQGLDCPLIIGYSAFVDKSVVKNAKEAGFDMILESPLTVAKIKS